MIDEVLGMDDLISRKALLAEYDRLHVGEPGRARKMIEDAPSVQPTQTNTSNTLDCISRPQTNTSNTLDCISRQAAIDAVHNEFDACIAWYEPGEIIAGVVEEILNCVPSARSEQHYCRECKWSWCHINVNKYGSTETYWHCSNWDGGTDEEGFCHEWERRINEAD